MLCYAGQLPTLELYTTLDRKEEVENECILERSIDGMDMVVGAFFKYMSFFPIVPPVWHNVIVRL